MPFDALKGLREALRAKEHITVERIDLTEYALEELDYKLRNITVGDIITVTYYHLDNYIKTTGMVSNISKTSRSLTIVKNKILFDDIREIT